MSVLPTRPAASQQVSGQKEPPSKMPDAAGLFPSSLGSIPNPKGLARLLPSSLQALYFAWKCNKSHEQTSALLLGALSIHLSGSMLRALEGKYFPGKFQNDLQESLADHFALGREIAQSSSKKEGKVVSLADKHLISRRLSEELTMARPVVALRVEIDTSKGAKLYGDRGVKGVLTPDELKIVSKDLKKDDVIEWGDKRYEVVEEPKADLENLVLLPKEEKLGYGAEKIEYNYLMNYKTQLLYFRDDEGNIKVIQLKLKPPESPPQEGT